MRSRSASSLHGNTTGVDSTLAGFRYRDLKHRRSPGSLTVYAIPTTAGVATVARVAPAPDASALARCESVATTLVLRGRAAVRALERIGYKVSR